MAAAVVFALTAPARADVDRVIAHVDHLTVDIESRVTETRGAQRAYEYIESTLREMGVEPERVHVVGVQVQPAISVGPMKLLPERRAAHDDPNVLARFGPAASAEAPAILIMGHYDTVPGSPGAVDNAVAVGVLLDLAAELAVRAPDRPVILAWTASEEYRTAGARALVEAIGPQVGLALSIDMIGAGGPINLNGLSALLGVRWLRWLREVGERAGVDVVAPIVHRVVSRHAPQVERSDHGVFTRRGIPAFHIYNRTDDGIYLPYHTRWDTIDRVDRRSVADAMAFAAALVATTGELPATGGDQGLWLDTPFGPVITSATVMLIAELVLIALGIAALVVMWRRRSRSRGAGLLAVIFVYAIAWLPVWLANLAASAATDHPQPWIHAPGRFMLCSLAMAAALDALGAALLARRGGPAGENRYLALAVAAALGSGVGLIAIGAPELAWLPLATGAALGAMAFAPHLAYALPLFALSALPVIAVIDPDILRESVWHGFYPRTAPLTPVLATMCLPHAMAAVYVVRRWARPMRTGRWQLRAAIAGAVATTAAATLLMSVPSPRCDGDSYRRAAISCENAAADHR